jgi:hypothetical protein
MNIGMVLELDFQNKLYNYFHASIEKNVKKDKNKIKCKKHI